MVSGDKQKQVHACKTHLLLQCKRTLIMTSESYRIIYNNTAAGGGGGGLQFGHSHVECAPTTSRIHRSLKKNSSRINNGVGGKA